MQRPLTVTFTTTDPTGGPTYGIQLPQQPAPGTAATAPASDGSVNFGDVPLGGPQFGVLLLLKFGDASGKSPRRALQQEGSGDKFHAITSAGNVRSSRVGDTEAYARDFELVNGAHLREFRFARGGHLYGAGIVYDPHDRVSLDTALAALQTLHWVS